MTQDLSTSFGEPAASRLRGLLPPRPHANGAGPPEPIDEKAAHHVPAANVPAPAPAVDDQVPVRESSPERAGRVTAPVPRPRREVGPHRPGGARRTTAPAPAGPESAATNRRWGMVRVQSREHVDLLVLSALRSGPAGAVGIIEQLRRESGGLLEAPVRTVHNTLHRLTRNRLLARVDTRAAGGPRYALTAAGERAATSRARQWRAFARAVDGVLREDDRA